MDSVWNIHNLLLFLSFKFLFKQFSQCRLIPSGHRRSIGRIDILEILLQAVQKLSHQEQLLPGTLLVAEQIAEQRIKLAYTEVLSVLDFLLGVSAEMCLAQTSCGVASAAIDQLFGKSQNRWSLHESFHVSFFEIKIMFIQLSEVPKEGKLRGVK